MNTHGSSTTAPPATNVAGATEPSRSGKVITVFNHKGGVGKTTTCVGLAWKLAAEDPESKVLIIDGDPQCNTTGFLVDAGRDFLESSDDKELQKALSDVDWDQEPEPLQRFYEEHPKCNLLASFAPLVYDEDRCLGLGVQPGVKLPTDVFQVSNRNLLLPEAARATISDVAPQPPSNLYVLGSHLELSDLEQRMFAQTVHTAPYSQYIPGCFSALFHLLMREHGFDYILCDVSPSASFLNRLIITSSDYLLMPCSLDYYSNMAMVSLSRHLPEWDRELRVMRPGKRLRESHRHFDLSSRRPVFLGHTQQLFTLTSHGTGQPAEAFRRWGDRIDHTVRTRLIPELNKHAMALPLECYGEDTHRGRLCNAQSLAPIASQLHIPLYAVKDARVNKVRNNHLCDTDRDKIGRIEAFFDCLMKLVQDPFGGRPDVAASIREQQSAVAYMLQHDHEFTTLDDAIRIASAVRGQTEPRATAAATHQPEGMAPTTTPRGPPTTNATATLASSTATPTATGTASTARTDQATTRDEARRDARAPQQRQPQRSNEPLPRSSQQVGNGSSSRSDLPARTSGTRGTSAKTRGASQRRATTKSRSTTTASPSKRKNQGTRKTGTTRRVAGGRSAKATSGPRSTRAHGEVAPSSSPSSSSDQVMATPAPSSLPSSSADAATSPAHTRSSKGDKRRNATRSDGPSAVRKPLLEDLARGGGGVDGGRNTVTDTLTSFLPPSCPPAAAASSSSSSSSSPSSQQLAASARSGSRQQQRVRTPRVTPRSKAIKDTAEPPDFPSTPTDSKRAASSALSRNLFADSGSSTRGKGDRDLSGNAARGRTYQRRHRRTAAGTNPTLACGHDDECGEPRHSRPKLSPGL